MYEIIDERQDGLSFVVCAENGGVELRKAQVHRSAPINVHFVVLGAPVALTTLINVEFLIVLSRRSLVRGLVYKAKRSQESLLAS